MRLFTKKKVVHQYASETSYKSIYVYVHIYIYIYISEYFNVYQVLIKIATWLEINAFLRTREYLKR